MSAHQPRILVVDDEESMRWFLERTLRREGYEVTVVPDGPEALRAAQAEQPALVLADVRMPGMDGVALLRALRTVAPGVPVVLMTAFGAVDDALDAMKQGATDYVTKPFRVDQIREVIKRSLGGTPRTPTVRDVKPESRDAGTDEDRSSHAHSATSVTPYGISESSPAAAQSAAQSSAPGAAQPRIRSNQSSPNGASAHALMGLGSYLRGRLAERSLPLPAECATGDLDLRAMTRLAETLYVDELLRFTDGNVSRAAEIAGITRPNFHRKIQDLGLAADSYRTR